MATKEPIVLTPEQEALVQQHIRDAESRPLVVVVGGQTGVGKSSLTNALFGTSLKTNDIEPETREPQLHREKNGQGNELWFWDMPGIGESEAADQRYLEAYGQKILEADVALWLLHADSRSVTFDLQAIGKILESRSPAEQSNMLSKLTFILSKCDLVAPQPWVLARTDRGVIVDASEATERLLDAKAAYFQRSLLAPWSHRLVSRTFHDGKLQVKTDRLTTDEHFAYYTGIMTASEQAALTKAYPSHVQVFLRLFQNSQVTYCSSRFRYNLARLMRMVVDRLGGDASLRFGKFTATDSMNRVPWEQAKKFSNVVVFDMARDAVTFDLTTLR